MLEQVCALGEFDVKWKAPGAIGLFELHIF